MYKNQQKYFKQQQKAPNYNSLIKAYTRNLTLAMLGNLC